MIETTPLVYRKYLFMYGVIPLLYTLIHFEEREQYDECKKIIDAIREQEERLNVKIPTKINDEAIDFVCDTYKKYGMERSDILGHCKYYGQIIINEIENG